MSWLFSQALVAEYSAGICSDGELSALSSGTPTPLAFCAPDKMTDFSRLSRFGTTFGPLTDDLGAAVLTWFLAGFPARTSALPARATDSTESDPDCGPKWRGSLARYDHDSRSWKTAQRSLLGGLDEYSETWPRWGMTADGECWELPTLAPRMNANASGLLPTLTRRDYRSDSCTPEVKSARDAHPRGKPLPWVLGGLVNPPWAEWFMGWPEGWTELKPLETDKYRNVPPLRGDCSPEIAA